MSLTLSSGRGDAARYELLFESLFQRGRGFAFPCDAEGRVNLDALSDQGRNNYLFARAVVGREFAVPVARAVNGPSPVGPPAVPR